MPAAASLSELREEIVSMVQGSAGDVGAYVLTYQPQVQFTVACSDGFTPLLDIIELDDDNAYHQAKLDAANTPSRPMRITCSASGAAVDNPHPSLEELREEFASAGFARKGCVVAQQQTESDVASTVSDPLTFADGEWKEAHARVSPDDETPAPPQRFARGELPEAVSEQRAFACQIHTR